MASWTSRPKGNGKEWAAKERRGHRSVLDGFLQKQKGPPTPREEVEREVPRAVELRHDMSHEEVKLMQRQDAVLVKGAISQLEEEDESLHAVASSHLTPNLRSRNEEVSDLLMKSPIEETDAQEYEEDNDPDMGISLLFPSNVDGGLNHYHRKPLELNESAIGELKGTLSSLFTVFPKTAENLEAGPPEAAPKPLEAPPAKPKKPKAKGKYGKSATVHVRELGDRQIVKREVNERIDTLRQDPVRRRQFAKEVGEVRREVAASHRHNGIDKVEFNRENTFFNSPGQHEMRQKEVRIEREHEAKRAEMRRREAHREHQCQMAELERSLDLQRHANPTSQEELFDMRMANLRLESWMVIVCLASRSWELKKVASYLGPLHGFMRNRAARLIQHTMRPKIRASLEKKRQLLSMCLRRNFLAMRLNFKIKIKGKAVPQVVSLLQAAKRVMKAYHFRRAVHRVALCKRQCNSFINRRRFQLLVMVAQWDRVELAVLRDFIEDELAVMRKDIGTRWKKLVKSGELTGDEVHARPGTKAFEVQRKRVIERISPSMASKHLMERMKDAEERNQVQAEGGVHKNDPKHRGEDEEEEPKSPRSLLAEISAHELSDFELRRLAEDIHLMPRSRVQHVPHYIKRPLLHGELVRMLKVYNKDMAEWRKKQAIAEAAQKEREEKLEHIRNAKKLRVTLDEFGRTLAADNQAEALKSGQEEIKGRMQQAKEEEQNAYDLPVPKFPTRPVWTLQVLASRAKNLVAVGMILAERERREVFDHALSRKEGAWQEAQECRARHVDMAIRTTNSDILNVRGIWSMRFGAALREGKAPLDVVLARDQQEHDSTDKEIFHVTMEDEAEDGKDTPSDIVTTDSDCENSASMFNPTSLDTKAKVYDWEKTKAYRMLYPPCAEPIDVSDTAPPKRAEEQSKVARFIDGGAWEGDLFPASEGEGSQRLYLSSLKPSGDSLRPRTSEQTPPSLEIKRKPRRKKGRKGGGKKGKAADGGGAILPPLASGGFESPKLTPLTHPPSAGQRQDNEFESWMAESWSPLQGQTTDQSRANTPVPHPLGESLLGSPTLPRCRTSQGKRPFSDAELLCPPKNPALPSRLARRQPHSPVLRGLKDHGGELLSAEEVGREETLEDPSRDPFARCTTSSVAPVTPQSQTRPLRERLRTSASLLLSTIEGPIIDPDEPLISINHSPLTLPEVGSAPNTAPTPVRRQEATDEPPLRGTTQFHAASMAAKYFGSNRSGVNSTGVGRPARGLNVAGKGAPSVQRPANVVWFDP